jgi:phenylacetate-CoA ligase
MPSCVGALERYRPDLVTGYPSATVLLAMGCREAGSDFSPRAVFTDSETLLDAQREGIEAAWDCKVIDYYGLEVGWVAGQCHEGAYHLNPRSNVVEIVDHDGSAVPPGVLGEIVVTDLTNPLMPLIRYRTGDVASWSVNQCECGWNTPTLERIEGRLDDLVVLPDGRKLGRLDHLFKKGRGIKEAQIVQEALDTVVIRIVPEKDYTQEDGEQVIREALLRFGPGVTVTIDLVPAIARTSRGKFRSVVSKVR